MWWFGVTHRQFNILYGDLHPSEISLHHKFKQFGTSAFTCHEPVSDSGKKQASRQDSVCADHEQKCLNYVGCENLQPGNYRNARSKLYSLQTQQLLLVRQLRYKNGKNSEQQSLYFSFLFHF